ncbi:MAG: DUF3540 domain-containing protein [Sandaracinaceae bacterium]
MGVTQFKEADATEAGASIETETGAKATVQDGRIHVHDTRGALIFEYRPDEGRSVVYAPEGDLELHAASGAIDLVGEEVRVRGRRSVELTSEEAVHVATESRGGRTLSRFSLLRRAAVLASPLLDATVAKARVELDEGALTARTTVATVQHALRAIDVLETEAGQILERAKESYRDVEGLSQSKAGRMRLVAEKTLHALGQRTLIKAYEDMKLRGEKIYLS